MPDNDGAAAVKRGRWGLGTPQAVALVFFLALVLAWRADAKAVEAALVGVVVRLLGALNARFLVGVLAAVLAARAWARTPLAPPGRTLGFTRHWGGLGSGEGGWEVDAHTVSWGLRALAALALSATALLLLFGGIADGSHDALALSPAASAPSASASALAKTPEPQASALCTCSATHVAGAPPGAAAIPSAAPSGSSVASAAPLVPAAPKPSVSPAPSGTF